MNSISDPDVGFEAHLVSPENSHRLIIDIKAAGSVLAQKLKEHPEIEAAWLAAAARMESTAAFGINKSIGESTPTAELATMHAHYADEIRHGNQLLEMRKTVVTSERGLALARSLASEGKRFTFGFFLHPVIREITQKAIYAGYVHAALTIEQIPFQLYAHYYVSTTGDARRSLGQILKDEHQHIKLGKRLYQQLEASHQHSIDAVQTIEMHMCLELIRNMSAHIDVFLRA